MKRTIKNIVLLGAALLASSCSLFQLDNYDAPEETLYGKVVDRNGNPVLTDQGSEGIRVRLMETSWEGNVNPLDFYCMPDGTFRNTKLFEADYNIRIDGPFIPIVRETSDGIVIEDNSVNTHIKGSKEVNFVVDPFLNVELLSSQISNGKITAKVRVTRGVSRDAFRDAVEPMGDFDPAFANITDIQLFVGYSSSMGYRNRDERWSNKIEYAGASFDAHLGEVVEITSLGAIPSNRKVFIRAAARINYDTPRGTGTKRWNYSQVAEVNVP